MSIFLPIPFSKKMSSGTLLSDLDSAPQLDGDNDLIQKIMADMNAEPPAPQMSANSGVISSPNPNSTFKRVADPMPATAHVIGHEHPTAGDFQAAIQPSSASHASSDSANWVPQQQQMPPAPKPAKKSWWSRIGEELKVPIFVALLVFVFSLPVINIIIGSYLPSLVKGTGDLTMVGLLLKSVAAGSTFWILQRVIVPLLSL
jgi:hypothetical protein